MSNTDTSFTELPLDQRIKVSTALRIQREAKQLREALNKAEHKLSSLIIDMTKQAYRVFRKRTEEDENAEQ